MPLYPLDQFEELIRAGNWTYLNERRPFRTKENLGWNDRDVVTMLLELRTLGVFQKTVPNCKVENHPAIELIDADQYFIQWTDEKGTVSLSLKIAIAEDIQGEFAGLVTLHTSS